MKSTEIIQNITVLGISVKKEKQYIELAQGSGKTRWFMTDKRAKTFYFCVTV